MCRAVMIALIALGLVETGVAQAEEIKNRLWIAPSPIGEDLERALREELPVEQIAISEDEADVRLTLEEERADLVIRMIDASRRVLVERRIALEDGRAPALRAAIVVVVEALKAPIAIAAPPPSTTEIVEPEGAVPTPLHLSVALGPEVSWSKTPGTLELGARASAELAWDPDGFGSPSARGARALPDQGPVTPVAFGVGLSVLGMPGWQAVVHQEMTGAETLVGRPRAIVPWLFGQWMFLDLDPLLVGARVEIGVSFDHIDARAAAFVGNAPVETRSNQSLQGGASAVVALPLFSDRVRLVLGLGAILRSSRLVVSLPAPFDNGSTPIDSGNVAPTASLSAVWRAF